MKLSIIKKPIMAVAVLSLLGGCESLSIGDIADVLAVADVGIPGLDSLDSLDALEELSDAEAVLAGVVMAAEVVSAAEKLDGENTSSASSQHRSPAQISSTDKGRSSFDGTTFSFTCPGGYSEPYEVPMPYQNPVCVEAAKQFSRVFVCNQVSKMQAAQTAFYSKCADEIYE